MLRVHYYRFDQDYAGWDLWVWEKGKEGTAHTFTSQECLSETQNTAMIAEIDVSGFTSKEAGIIIRQGGWNERDLTIDRYISLENKDKDIDIYLVQSTPEIFTSREALFLLPGFAAATFENFREIFVRLQTPAKETLDMAPFQVFEDGTGIPVRHVTPSRSSREFVISLERDMVPGKTYMIYKQGFRPGAVDYGMIYDTPEFEELFTYEKDDLGATWTPEETMFRVWAPTVSSIFLNVYDTGSGPGLRDVFEMCREEKGVWSVRVPGDLSGAYYTYSTIVTGKIFEAADPYAYSSGVNGKRSMVLDPSRTNPQGWESISHIRLDSSTDAVLYEVHVRDITIHPNSGVTHRGKYLGLAEKDTRSPENLPTGLSHLQDLGITHVHLMPVSDFFTVDEAKNTDDQYNWGYDPTNMNVPEGSYATDPFDGSKRVKELKQMIQSIKETGIGVVLDVVYNHTYKTLDSDFNKLVPGYYYRRDRSGNYSNGSGCGNELASDRSMVRRFMVSSVKRWATEYKVDGFRFDLMGLHDIDTMNEIRAQLDRISPSILIYGEGWAGGPSLLSGGEAATKVNAAKLDRIGFFNDNTRDGIKGDAFHQNETGFISGNLRSRESVKFGITGAVFHPGTDYKKVNYSGFAWASYAWHCVNYTASHDNLTLYDKLRASRQDLDEAELIKLVCLAGAIVLTSQGIPFFTLGTDFMRSKKGEHNSYNLPDEINQVDWSLKYRYQQVFNYHKGLVALRKAHPAFRMTDPDEIRRNLAFYSTPDWAIAFSLGNHANHDPWSMIFVYLNAGIGPETAILPREGMWQTVVDGTRAGLDVLGTVTGGSVQIPPRSAMVLYSGDGSRC